LVLPFQGTDRFEFLRGEGQEVAKLPDGTDGVLGLPAPVVPGFVGYVVPDGVAPRLTGRFFFFNPPSRRGYRARVKPSALLSFVHRIRCLQKDSECPDRPLQLECNLSSHLPQTPHPTVKFPKYKSYPNQFRRFFQK